MFAVLRAIVVAGTVALAFGLNLSHGDWMVIAAMIAMKASAAARQRVRGDDGAGAVSPDAGAPGVDRSVDRVAAGIGLVRQGLPGALGEPGQPLRSARFRAAHPEVIIGDGGFGTVQAHIPEPDGETVITRYTLRELLHSLDELTTGPNRPAGLRSWLTSAPAALIALCPGRDRLWLAD